MMKRMIAVDEEKCIHCGMCLRDCVASCLEFDDQKIPRYIKDGEKMCLACQHCLAVCPTGAFPSVASIRRLLTRLRPLTVQQCWA